VEQLVRFCAAPDTVRIAYEMSGSGPSLVKVANLLTHLEFDRESAIWLHWLGELGRRFRLTPF
jgi:hypothetical protein